MRPATEFGPYAPQQVPFYAQPRATRMSEDCLYLNVWTGAVSGQEHRPVYLFTHGGAFLTGDGSNALYDGESMARQGVVHVTLNYCLGALGFLAHPEPNPNGMDVAGAPLPVWPALRPGSSGQVLRIDATPRVESNHTRDRYLLLQQIGYHG